MSKEAYYFSHDANARQDPKILALMSVYGAEGYGWYWILVEMLREQSDFTLDKQGKYSFNAIAMQMHCNKDTAEKFVHDCIAEFELFETDGVRFWSNSLLRRMAMKEEISQKRKKAAQKRWSKQEEDTNDMQMHNTSNANGMQGKEKKVNKGKEIKESKLQFADTVFLTQEEYDRLVSDYEKRTVDNYIERLDEWQSNNPKKQKKDHNKTLRVWMKDIKKPVGVDKPIYDEYTQDRNVVSQVNGCLF